MKNPVADYVKQAKSTLRGIDIEQLADLVHRTGLPIEIRRARPSLFKRVMKYALPILGLMLLGGYVLYRKLIVCNDCHDVSNDVDVQKPAEESQPSSDWTPSVDGNTKEAEIS